MDSFNFPGWRVLAKDFLFGLLSGLIILALFGLVGRAFGQEPPVEPVSEQPLTGPITDTLRAIKELRADCNAIKSKLANVGQNRAKLIEFRERFHVMDGRFGVLSKTLDSIRDRQAAQGKAMQGWLSDRQKEMTERKRIKAEIEKVRAEAEVAASEARKYSAEIAKYRQRIVIALCVSGLAVFFALAGFFRRIF